MSACGSLLASPKRSKTKPFQSLFVSTHFSRGKKKQIILPLDDFNARSASCLMIISFVMYASRRILSLNSGDMSGIAHRTQIMTKATKFWNRITFLIMNSKFQG